MDEPSSNIVCLAPFRSHPLYSTYRVWTPPLHEEPTYSPDTKRFPHPRALLSFLNKKFPSPPGTARLFLQTRGSPLSNLTPALPLFPTSVDLSTLIYLKTPVITSTSSPTIKALIDKYGTLPILHTPPPSFQDAHYYLLAKTSHPGSFHQVGKTKTPYGWQKRRNSLARRKRLQDFNKGVIPTAYARTHIVNPLQELLRLTLPYRDHLIPLYQYVPCTPYSAFRFLGTLQNPFPREYRRYYSASRMLATSHPSEYTMALSFFTPWIPLWKEKQPSYARKFLVLLSQEYRLLRPPKFPHPPSKYDPIEGEISYV